MSNIKLSPRIGKFVALFVIIVITLGTVIYSLVYVFQRKEAVKFALTNYEDVMMMKETANGIDGTWKNVNRKESLAKGLAFAVLEASDSGKFVSPLPTK